MLVGHSFGADAAITMSADLAAKGIPVDLVVIFDATARQPVPANVRHLINFYSADRRRRKEALGRQGFPWQARKHQHRHAEERAIDHFNIEKQAAFHKRVIGEVLALYGRRS